MGQGVESITTIIYSGSRQAGTMSLFDRAPAGALTPAPAGAVPNAYFGKGSAWGAGQEPELFFACVGEA